LRGGAGKIAEAMDWDSKTTMPSKKKLLKLGIDDVAEVLRPGE
jgi:hypothetical protein